MNEIDRFPGDDSCDADIPGVTRSGVTCFLLIEVALQPFPV